MGQRYALSQAEKEEIYRGKLAGKSLKALAAEIGCSVSCARKWWRQGRDEGLKGLRRRRRGRGPSGILSQFEPEIVTKALRYKRTHPLWGARRVLVELRRELGEAEEVVCLPSASRLAVFFKEKCPECVASPKPRDPPPPRPPRASGVHEIWQLDSQEGIHLADGEVATMCNVRDEVGCAQIASQAFSVKTDRHWRKLTTEEIQQLLRAAFTEWRTLPNILLTDNELVLAGCPTDPYPSLITQWLVGLGVKHMFIRPGCPKDQPHIERSHRTLDNFAFSQASLANLASLQQALDTERHQHNHLFPSRAGDCAGRPPLVAHPQLMQPRRPYHPQHELSLFSLQRVADYLASFNFERKVSPAGQISLGRLLYSVGRRYAGQTVQVRFDPDDWLWVVTSILEDDVEAPPQQETILVRRVPKNFSVETITGLDPKDYQPQQPVQLTFPCLIA